MLRLYKGFGQRIINRLQALQNPLYIFDQKGINRR